MSSTSKVLGTIGAIQTLTQNFPMGLLDLFKGKVYTSAFDFIIDVLYACGVNTNEIIEYLLKEIYSIENKIATADDDLINRLNVGDLTGEQSEFLETLEYSIKGILMSLLSSIYTCSAIPVIPNKFIDKPCKEKYGDNINISLWENDSVNSKPFYPRTLSIPIAYIDPMGIMEMTPTTSDGRLYYMVEGRDVYYKKQEKEVEMSSVFSRNRKGLRKNIPLYMDLTDDNFIIFKIMNEDGAPEDINISVGYIAYNENNLCEWSTVIRYGEEKSENIFKIWPQKENSHLSVIRWIKLNGEYYGFNTINNDWVYISENFSEKVIKLWGGISSDSLKTIKWGDENTPSNIVLGASNFSSYEYIECGYSNESKNAIRVYQMPNQTSINSESPEYIVCYTGITPTNLYKTYDMNAFLWYVLRKGNSSTQLEKNHMVWDSRYSASKKGVMRLNPESWNNWYNSKGEDGEEFQYDGQYIEKGDALYPILQIEPGTNSFYEFNITFPAQRYYKPKLREDDTLNPALLFNSSLYRFNWEYLESIQILKPKLMLAGLCNYLLGFTMSVAMSTKVNLTKKIIENKLSTAVKKIIEADDMEIEDCYTSFSNEEFENLLQEMLLSRYDATYYGGETTTIKTHSVEDYINTINSISETVSRNGNVETIQKLITEVTVDPGTEGSISYGIQLGVDNNLLNKLIWALTMPIVESLFTPQVMLLLLINFGLTGVVKLDSFANQDLTLILNFLMNKIMGIVKSIIRFIKDKIIEILLRLFYEKVLPLLIKYELIILLEKITYWLEILKSALECLPRFNFKNTKIKGAIDNVDYADIIPKENDYTNIENTQIGPDAAFSC